MKGQYIRLLCQLFFITNLCFIHPFADGNGRMSQIMAYGNAISLEKCV
ncbi:MAG: Fic family protein [Oscillibacter sp.]